MATTDAAGQGASHDNASTMLIKIMSPSSEVPTGLQFEVLTSSTVDELKELIRATIETQPTLDRQRLIYRGKVLDGNSAIGPTLIGNEKEESYTLHLVIRPTQTQQIPAGAPAPNLFPNPTRSPWTGPINSNNIFRTAGAPAQTTGFSAFPGQPPVSRSTTTSSYSRGGNTFTTTTTTSVATSFTPRRTTAVAGTPAGATPAVSTGEQVPQTDEAGLDMWREAIRGIASPRTASLHARRTNNASPQPDLGQMRLPIHTPSASTSARNSNTSYTGTWEGPNEVGIDEENEARRRALRESLREMEEEDMMNGGAPSSYSADTTAAPFGLPFLNLPAGQPSIPTGSQVYLLQDFLNRPYSILVAPPGSAYQPQPQVQPLGYPNMLANPIYNPNLIPPIGPIPGGVPMPVAAGPAFAAQLEQAAALRRQLLNVPFPQAQMHGGQRNNNINIPRVIQRVRNRAVAAHMWLALKLVVFVVLFAGNGGWRRMTYFGAIALAIFFWQTGLAAEFGRPIMEAINPPPPANMQAAATRQPIPVNNARPGPFGAIQRGVAIFLASLVPGMHERHVNAVQQAQAAQEAARLAAEAAANPQPEQQQEPGPEPVEANGAEVVGGVM